jgi:hypothetical protein
MILHTCVKKCDFYLEKGDFIMFMMIGQPNDSLPPKKKKKKKTTKRLCYAIHCN